MVLGSIQELLDNGMQVGRVPGICSDLVRSGYTDKALVLLSYLVYESATPDEIVPTGFPGSYKYHDRIYLVLDSFEVDKVVTSRIAESLWSFNRDFLSSATGLSKEVFAALSELGEDANDAFVSLVQATCGLDIIVSQATAIHGRGYYLAAYDGEEVVVRIADKIYFVYRS